MSRVRYYAAATLDGFLARPDDSLDWLLDYEGTYEGGEERGTYDDFYAEIGALVMGSATYEWLLNHMERAMEELGQQGSWPYSGKPTWIFTSRELPRPADEKADVRFASGPVSDHIGDLLEAAGDRDLWIVGGGGLASQFAEIDRLDTVEVTVVPVAIGDGKPLFGRELPGPPLQLKSVTPMASGMVELRYERSL